MPIAKRKGRIRLGIVLSLAWGIGVLLFAAFEFQSVRTDFVASVNSPNPADVAAGWRTTGQQTLFTRCEVSDKQVSCSPRLGILALLIVVSIGIAWLLIIAVAYAILRVREGFRR